MPKGLDMVEVVSQGAHRRLRPVMMTASIRGIGLTPLLFATGPGSKSAPSPWWLSAAWLPVHALAAHSTITSGLPLKPPGISSSDICLRAVVPHRHQEHLIDHLLPGSEVQAYLPAAMVLRCSNTPQTWCE